MATIAGAKLMVSQLRQLFARAGLYGGTGRGAHVLSQVRVGAVLIVKCQLETIRRAAGDVA